MCLSVYLCETLSKETYHVCYFVTKFEKGFAI
jgi:hypothetical protein